MLDPRPAANSPALNDYADVPGGYVEANYRGAFGPGNRNWAANWTALSEYAILTGAGAGVLTGEVSDTLVAPSVAVAPSGANVNITFDTQAGVTYQAQSTTSLTGPVTWTNEGAPIVGTGAAATVTVSGAADQKFIIVRAE